MGFIQDNISVKDGVLYFAGQSTPALAKKYGTPLYLMDEDKIRENCRMYVKALRSHFGETAQLLYASKACSFKRIYEIMREENVGIDVSSPGEMYTAIQAGYDLKNAYFHGNNKTNEDIGFGLDNHVGYFVADNVEEIRAIEQEAASRGTSQKVLLRLTPGIDPHTYEAISTGKVDSKFGSAIETGQAEAITRFTLDQPHIDLKGFHCHVGSQVFGENVFERAADTMLRFIAEVSKKYGYKTQKLDLGGGFGVRYVESDPMLDIDKKFENMAATIRNACVRFKIDIPELCVEPGRSIVAAAGMTLYTVGTVKVIPGYKNYVSVDGGMADNPRFALYRAAYTCLPANRMDEQSLFECNIVGRCCESGDIIQEHVLMPPGIGRGDLIAVCTTGAYNYSMASNYNRLLRPPIVMLCSNGKSYVAVRRETLQDLCRNDT